MNPGVSRAIRVAINEYPPARGDSRLLSIVCLRRLVRVGRPHRSDSTPSKKNEFIILLKASVWTVVK
jgi:hypothetical protein